MNGPHFLRRLCRLKKVHRKHPETQARPPIGRFFCVSSRFLAYSALLELAVATKMSALARPSLSRATTFFL